MTGALAVLLLRRHTASDLMRAVIVLLALSVSGCSLIPVLLLTPDGGPRPSQGLSGPRIGFFATPARVDSALQHVDVEWGGIDRLSVTLASGERRSIRPDVAGIRVQDGILAVRSRGRAETLPLASVSRFVARKRPTAFEALGLTAAVAVGGAFIGGLTGALPENAGWQGVGRGAAVGAAIGAGVGALASTADRDSYDVHVAGFETP